MKISFLILGFFALSLMVFPSVSAIPSIEIILEQKIFSYGENLLYTIQVSEVTGDLAIIHIRDEFGKGSSAIPIEISQLKTEVPSPFPFEKQVFPEGKYFIDLQYSGAEQTVEFNIIDSGAKVIPYYIKDIAFRWINNEISGGILIDAMQKIVQTDVINIPHVIDKDNLGEIYVPNWTKIITVWWLEGKISDETFANAFQFLIDERIIEI